MKTSYVALLLGTVALMPAAAYAQTNAGQSNAGTNAARTAATQNPGATTAASLSDQSVYTSSGREVGTIDRVVVGRDGQAYAALDLDDAMGAGDRTVLVPITNLNGQNDRLILHGYKVSQIKRLPAYTDQAGYKAANNNQRLDIPGYNTAANDTDQNRSRFIVQQTAPTVNVDQAAPRILVRQSQPDVTVRQPQPQIIVRQAPPTITVDQPQPEIIVRMPKPDVNVAMAQPQVSVNMPQPQVQVQQPQQQPQVQVQRAQPRVQFQAANQQPDVNVQEQGQPQVQYERSGQPKVVYNQAKGQPTIRYEQMNDQQNAAAGTANQQANAQPARRTADQDQALRERLGVGEDVENTAAVSAQTPASPIKVSDLDGMDVYNAKGNNLGEVDRVIVNPTTNKQYLVLTSGGFLGLGADHVAFPLERFWRRGDHLVIRGVTQADIDQMDNWKSQVSNYRTLDGNQTAQLRAWQG